MTAKNTYEYTILRYMHDVRTQEFLNVGAFLYAPERQVLVFQGIDKTRRLTGAFPSADARLVLKTVEHLGEAIRRAAGDLSHCKRLEDITNRVLPKDDSALKWAPISAGISDDPRAAFISLYKRFVERYQVQRAAHVRSDHDVWKTLRLALDRRGVLEKLRRASVKSPMRAYTFQHCWSNHKLHALVPISLDGESGDDIAEKASSWGGKIHDLARSSEDFALHMIIGQPESHNLAASFAEAQDFIRVCLDNSRMEVRPESESDNLAETVALCSAD